MNDFRSDFGRKLGGHTGINELMSDLGEAMAINPRLLMMGGGNPARIPAMEQVWRREMQALLARGDAFDRMLGCYDQPRGNPEFIAALVDALNQRYGWGLTARNVCVTNGSQNSCFYLFNLLGGRRGSQRRRILLPLSPEYIGYADQGLEPGLFTSCRPRIEERPGRVFKYGIDFDQLRVDDDVAAICVSRPTNPTGNVLTDEEMRRLHGLAKQHDIFLMIDNAYGNPFPGILFEPAELFWDERVILTLSLSKLGLPGTRCGIIIAREDVIEAVAATNAVIGLANANLGPALVAPLLRSGEIFRLSAEVIRPFYEARSRQAQAWLGAALGDAVPWRVHASEGALFLWLWLKDLPIPSRELYRRLKQRELLVVSGDYFFYALPGEWPHKHECLRLTYSQAESVVERGLGILADEVKAVYAGARV